ncbi:MAG: M17 family peptidase N-terminal domain-containing protein, partial [Planctomycetota bacterium]
MSTSRFATGSDYRPRSGDLLLLLSVGGTRLFDPRRLPKDLRDVGGAPVAAGTRTVYAGRIGRARVRVDAVGVETKVRTAEEGVKTAVAKALEGATEGKLGRVVVALDGGRGPEFARAAHEGAVLGAYRFDRYLSKKKRRVAALAVLGRAAGEARRTARGDAVIFEEVNAARDILNEPANVANPGSVARSFRRAGRRAGLRVDVWNRARLQR